MGKLNQDFSDCIRQGSKLKNGGFVLVGMRGVKVLLFSTMFFTLLMIAVIYAIPNSYSIVFPSFIAILFRFIVLCSTLLCGIIVIRLIMIYREDKPWKKGLEYSIYFYIVIFLFGISCSLLHIRVYYYLPAIPRLSIYIYLLLLILVLFWSLSVLMQRVRGTQQQNEKQKKLKEYQKVIGVSSTIGVIIFLLTRMFSTDFKLWLVYVCSGLMSCFFFWAWPFIIQNIYVFVRYRKDLDLDCCYQKIDGIDPQKNYKGKF